MRIIYEAKRQDHTNLFINLNVMKLFYYIEYKTAITMYQMKYNLLPKNILKLFHLRDECYKTDRSIKIKYVRTTMKAMCMTTVGVKLWNSLSVCLRKCQNNCTFKKGTNHLLLRDMRQ